MFGLFGEVAIYNCWFNHFKCIYYCFAGAFSSCSCQCHDRNILWGKASYISKLGILLAEVFSPTKNVRNAKIKSQ